MIHIENLVKRYGDLIALDHLNLDIKEGEIFGLLGPNGSGKSTAIGCMLALLKYDKGTIQIFGKNMTPDSYDIKKEIGVVMQNVAVFHQMSVRENVDYFCGLYVTDKQKLIIMDEPTVAVDPQSRNRILEGILELNRQGSTIIYTSHYMEEVEQICSRIAIIDHGHVLATGTCEELKNMIKTGETITIEAINLNPETLSEIRTMPNVFELTYEEQVLKIRLSGGKHNLISLLKYLGDHNISFGRVFSELPTLNDVFLEITGKELRD